MVQFVSRRIDGKDVIEIRTERMDYSLVEDFKELSEEILKPGSSGVVVNLSGVAFIDSKAIGALVSMRKRAVAKGIPFALCGLTEYVMRIISVVTLNTIFDIFPGEAEALSGLSAPKS